MRASEEVFPTLGSGVGAGASDMRRKLDASPVVSKKKCLCPSIQEDVAGNLTLYLETHMVAGIPDLCSESISGGNRYTLAVHSSLLR